MTSRRRRQWTSVNGQRSIATSGEAGQQFLVLDTSILAEMGLASMVGMTIVRTFLSIMFQSESDETTTSPVTLYTAIGVYPDGMDSGDFPDLQTYEGDWLLYRTHIFRLPGVVSTLVLPESVSVSRSESKSIPN